MLKFELFFKPFTINPPYLSYYGLRIHKDCFDRSFGITMKHFTKQNSFPFSQHEQQKFKPTTLFTCQKEKKLTLFLEQPSATNHCPPSNVYHMDFYRNFVTEYSLIGMLKPLFTKRYEIRCRILKIEDSSENVRKTQDRTSSSRCFQKGS